MIQLNGVVKKFNKIPALDGLDIKINKGSIYGLVGTNGAGKTTVIKSIMGIQRPDEGTITIDGETVYENPSTKAKLGYVPDDIYFFPNHNLGEMAKYLKGIYPKWSRERFNRLIKDFELNPKRKISSFSKGMQKQAAIILALSVMPECLILDEPIDGLDPLVRLKVWKHIIDDVAKRNMTVLISSHNLREMEGYCDYIGIIADGKMVIERDLENLKSDVHKVQVAFKENEAADYFKLNVLHKETRGSVDILIIKDSREKIENVLRAAKPAVFDILPLSLEEIFIYELGGANDEINKII